MVQKFGEKGQEFFDGVLACYEMQDAHDLARLEMAAKCLDEIEAAEDLIRVGGRYTTNRYGATIEHPAGKVVRDLRTLFIKIVRELGLDLPVPESRPPRQY